MHQIFTAVCIGALAVPVIFLAAWRIWWNRPRHLQVGLIGEGDEDSVHLLSRELLEQHLTERDPERAALLSRELLQHSRVGYTLEDAAEAWARVKIESGR
jgi:hypothetical protein